MKAILLAVLLSVMPLGGWVPGGAGGEGDAVAIETIVVSRFDMGRARLEFDYNRNTSDVLRFRCVNDSERSLYGEVREITNPETREYVVVWSGTCQAHTTAALPVSSLKFSVNPGGWIELGPYRILTRWPG